jgi:type I restriction enzyme S subunit
LFWTKINNDVLEPRYFFYNLRTIDFASKDVGSAVPSLTTELLNNLEINLPPLPEQRAIAAILSSLDDKIEFNLQMNKTLEEMAMTLYKHWFVDFEFPTSTNTSPPFKEEYPQGEVVFSIFQ